MEVKVEEEKIQKKKKNGKHEQQAKFKVTQIVKIERKEKKNRSRIRLKYAIENC